MTSKQYYKEFLPKRKEIFQTNNKMINQNQLPSKLSPPTLKFPANTSRPSNHQGIFIFTPVHKTLKYISFTSKQYLYRDLSQKTPQQSISPVEDKWQHCHRW